MGSGHSFPELNQSQNTLEIVDQNLEVVPYRIPKINKLQVLNLSGNRIMDLPPRLNHLTTLILVANQISEFSPKMISAILGYKSLQKLNISNNLLSEIPPQFTKIETLKQLLVGGNLLSEIPEITSPIDTLALMQNRFTTVPKLPKSILNLSMEYNLLEVFDTPIPTLVRLFLNMNRITSIDPGLSFQNLETLEIAKNRLNSIPDLTAFAPNLTKFDASLNYFTEFPIFPPSIKEISLVGNRIKNISSLVQFKKLEKFDISFNVVEQLPELPPSLQSLTITGNQINVIEPSEVPKLSRLFAQKNLLTQLPPFKNNSLTELFVMRNCICEIDISNYCHAITRINLVHNRITKIPKDIFNLPKLSHLNLVRNLITEIPAEIANSNLVCFNISENPVSEIPNKLPKSLVALYCSYTEIKSLPDSLGTLKNLETLVACGNQLTNVNLPQTVKKLLLSRNKFSKIPEKLPTYILILDMSCNEIERLPDNFNFPALLEADFSYNNISNLPTNFECFRLRSFKMSHNNINADLDLQHFPFLDCIDISFTNVNIDIQAEDLIREVVTSNRKMYNSSRYKLVTINEDWASFAEMCGQREAMEDAVVVRPKIFKNIDLFCVFDGHGGSGTSTYCAYHIAQDFASELAEFSEEFVSRSINNLQESLKAQNLTDGSTLALALVSDQEVIVAHLGDSRVLLISEDGIVRHNTEDHKPDNRNEFDRILEMGGKVTGSRTNGMVAVARCLGDFGIYGVTSEPTIKRITLDPNDRWIVVACDGIFDLISNQEIGEIATKAENARNLAYDLRNMAYNRLCPDNISAITVDLKRRNQNV